MLDANQFKWKAALIFAAAFSRTFSNAALVSSIVSSIPETKGQANCSLSHSDTARFARLLLRIATPTALMNTCYCDFS